MIVTHCLQVPLGLDDAGLPLGLQVVGAHGNDAVTIAVSLALGRVSSEEYSSRSARCVEKGDAGWIPPPLMRGVAMGSSGRGDADGAGAAARAEVAKGSGVSANEARQRRGQTT